MSNYTVTTNFGSKDNLNSGNPSKVVKGSELTTEFDNIATAIATKSEEEIPTGTKMLFIETSAPSGWTINNDYDDKAILLRTSGNITDDDTPDTAGNWTIDNITVDAHTHSVGNLSTAAHGTGSVDGSAANATVVIGANHSIVGNTGNANVDTITDTGNWRPAHVEGIICSKN